MSHKYLSKGGALRGLGDRYRLHAKAWKRILRPVGPQDASLARRLSEILLLDAARRLACSLRARTRSASATLFALLTVRRDKPARLL
jgi:hypothetical protein